MHAYLSRRLAILLVGAALVLGLAAGSFSYLSHALAFPAPARASVEVLRQRGADAYFEFCSWPKFEPRFWPECVGGADDWRARGADRLVAYCTDRVPSRQFGAYDCLSDEQPGPTLTAPPHWQDLALGGAVGLSALTALVLVAISTAPLRRRRAAT